MSAGAPTTGTTAPPDSPRGRRPDTMSISFQFDVPVFSVRVKEQHVRHRPACANAYVVIQPSSHARALPSARAALPVPDPDTPPNGHEVRLTL